MPVMFLAWANIRKKRGVACSMGILIMLAVAMFNVGLTLLAGINQFYDRENDRLNGAHYMVRFTGDGYSEDYLKYFQELGDEIESVQSDDVVVMDMASFLEGGAISVNFQKYNNDQPIKGYTLEAKADEIKDDGVYIPSFFKEMGYKQGDSLSLKFNNQVYDFRIAGYIQSTWFNSSVSSLVNIYVSDQLFDQLFEELGGGTVLSVRCGDISQISRIKQEFRDNTDVKIEAVTLDAEVMDFTLNEMRTGCTMVVTILSAVLFAFSFLMVLVAMIVIRFRITNHIEEQMQTIGALEAVGYTGRQIKWSIAAEFLMIGVMGTLVGIAVSYGIIGALGGLITSSVGVAWRSGGHMGFEALSALFIMAVVLLVSQCAAARAARILPIQALRGGVKSHNFKKSHFPLDRTKGRLTAVLGFKNIMFNRKTYGMLGVIFSGIAFASGFAVMVWCNMGLNDTLVLQMTGYEISDITAYMAPHADYDAVAAQINQMEGVRKTTLYEMESAEVEGEMLTNYVSDDFSRLEMVEVYEGSMPRYDNEVVVTGVLAKGWGKQIGDSIKISVDGTSAEYIICGLGQTMSNFGRQCYLTTEGISRINPHYEKKSVQIYLEPEVDIDAFIAAMEQQLHVLSPSKEVSVGSDPEDPKTAAARKAEEKLTTLLSKYGADSAQYALMVDGEVILNGDTRNIQIDRIDNNRLLFVANVNSIAASAELMSVMILVGTALMIILVFYMVIKSMLVRRKTEFGIYKAIGYTNRQLMEQISFSFLPVSILGTLAGSIISGLTVNGISSALFQNLGISKLDLSVNPLVMAAMGIGIVLFSFMVSMIVARKMKDITVYGLLTEE